MTIHLGNNDVSYFFIDLLIFLVGLFYSEKNNKRAANDVLQYKEQRKKERKKWREMLSGVRINAMFQSCNL